MVVTERNKVSGSKGAEALRWTSVIARSGSTQPMDCAESKRLLTIFSSPQLEESPVFQTFLLLHDLWLLRWRKRISGILWLYVLHLRRKGKDCLQSDVLVPQQWVYSEFTVFSDFVVQVRLFLLRVLGGQTGFMRNKQLLLVFVLVALVWRGSPAQSTYIDHYVRVHQCGGWWKYYGSDVRMVYPGLYD